MTSIECEKGRREREGLVSMEECVDSANKVLEDYTTKSNGKLFMAANFAAELIK